MSKITWSDQQTIVKEATGLYDAPNLVKFKRDMQIGASKFLAMLGREYNRRSITLDMVSGTQYYDVPVTLQKIKEVTVSTGTYRPPMEQIPDEFAWNMMNMLSITGQPTHFFARYIGNRVQLGLYPTPANSINGAITIIYSPKHVQMTADDYTTGTIQVTNNNTAVIGTTTTFTAAMVGEWLQTDDESWYQIAAFTDATHITLAVPYGGTSGSGKSYRIGQIMDMPEEFLEAPADYAAYRHYLRRGNTEKTAEFKALWQEALDNAKDTYGNTTDSQVIAAEPQFRIYNPFRGDPPASITS